MGFCKKSNIRLASNSQKIMNLCEELKQSVALQDIVLSCDIPRIPPHPLDCPQCSQKVLLYHINLKEAIFMCSNENCPWPLDSIRHPDEIIGQSDVTKLVKAMAEDRNRKQPFLDEIIRQSDVTKKLFSDDDGNQGDGTKKSYVNQQYFNEKGVFDFPKPSYLPKHRTSYVEGPLTGYQEHSSNLTGFQEPVDPMLTRAL